MLKGLEVTNLLGPPGAFSAPREGPVWPEQQVLHYSEEYFLHISQPEGERRRSEVGSFPWYLRTTQPYRAFCPNSVHKCSNPHIPSPRPRGGMGMFGGLVFCLTSLPLSMGGTSHSLTTSEATGNSMPPGGLANSGLENNHGPIYQARSESERLEFPFCANVSCRH